MVKPGYKQTEIGVIPEDWEIKKIINFTDCTAGGTPSTRIKEFWNGDIRWMASGELHQKHVNEVEGRITEYGLKNSSTKIIPKNCVLVGLAGQGKTRGTVALNNIELCTNQSIAAIYPNDSFDSKYLYYNLDNRYDELRELSTGDGGRGGLNLTIIRNIEIPFPYITEQQAIAEALSDVDALIASLEKLIAKKRDIKTATMQQLLTGKTRLPGFSVEWEETTFGAYCKPRKEKKSPEYLNANTICIELDNMEQGTGIIIKSELRNDTKSTKTIFYNGDVLFGKLRPYLRKYWIADIDGVCSTEIWVFETNKQKLLQNYLYQLIITDQFIETTNISFGTHMPRADWNVVKEYKIFLPLIDEQKEIAKVLSTMQNEIEQLQTRLDKTKAIKQGMMQELLTGRTRLL